MYIFQNKVIKLMYKQHKILLSQNVDNVPIIKIAESTLVGNISFERFSAGYFKIISDLPEFTEDKKIIWNCPNKTTNQGDTPPWFNLYRLNDYVLIFEVWINGDLNDLSAYGDNNYIAPLSIEIH